MKINQRLILMTGCALLAAFGLLLTGCESDSVAPQDDLPTLTESGAASQAALTAMGVASVTPEIVQFAGKNLKDMETYDFTGTEGITGTVNLEFWTGGSTSGTPATYSNGDYARLWTPDATGIVGEVDTGGSVSLTLDIQATIVQATPKTATIVAGSGGTFTSGEYVAEFAFVNLQVTSNNNYPTAGSMTFSSEGFDMEISFDGSTTATIAIDNVDSWTVDLTDGTKTAI